MGKSRAMAKQCPPKQNKKTEKRKQTQKTKNRPYSELGIIQEKFFETVFGQLGILKCHVGDLN